MLRISCVTLIVLSVGCSKDNGGALKVEPAPSRPSTPTPEEKPAPSEPATGYITTNSAIRKGPTDAKTVDDPSGKKINDYVATLYRGEKVSTLKVQDDWLQIRASDDSEGWVRKNAVLAAKEVVEAAAVEEIDSFERPDVTAIKPNAKISVGTLVFVLKTKDQFQEVNAGGTGTVWVMGSRLSPAAHEVMVAKLLTKIRWLNKEKKGAGVEELLKVAKTEAPDAKLLPVLLKEAGAETAATATAAKP